MAYAGEQLEGSSSVSELGAACVAGPSRSADRSRQQAQPLCRPGTAAPAASPGQPLLVVLCDLDGFKAYNDTFGHAAGDTLLTRLAQNLDTAMVDRGSAYRMGGHEFRVLASVGPRDPTRSQAALEHFRAR